jgi:hypothetical protein
VLAANLPPGCALMRAMGGPASVSDETNAVFLAANRLVSILWTGLGGNKNKVPRPLEPPEAGWQDKQAEREEHAARKAARWMSRQHSTSE